MLKIIDKVLTGGVKILDEVITSDEERLALMNELEEISARDRDSARKMYEDDSVLQKIYAIVFLVSYMLLIVAMLIFIYNVSAGDVDQSGIQIAKLEIPEWAVAFLSSLFGAMTAKISTITDFLFGGSKSSDTISEKRRRK